MAAVHGCNDPPPDVSRICPESAGSSASRQRTETTSPATCCGRMGSGEHGRGVPQFEQDLWGIPWRQVGALLVGTATIVGVVAAVSQPTGRRD
jgi:hypothetical protein